MKRTRLRTIGIEEGKETQVKGTENITKNIRKNISELKKDIPIKVQEAYTTPNRLCQKIKSPWHIIMKTLKVHNKERMLKAEIEKD